MRLPDTELTPNCNITAAFRFSVACIAVGHPAETKEPRTRFNPAYVRFEK